VKVSGSNIDNKGIGTVIGRTSKAGARKYEQLWIYIPRDMASDSMFKLKAGDPCQIELDIKTGGLAITQISESEAKAKGWARRERRKKA
jgi:hypothetical protein